MQKMSVRDGFVLRQGYVHVHRERMLGTPTPQSEFLNLLGRTRPGK